MSDAPLQGVNVLEVGHIVAGPTAGMILSQLGASVIKVEEPTRGDQARSSPIPGTFTYLNRGKQSVTIDLKSVAGKASFEKLITRADILVTNLGPGVTDRLGLTWEALKHLNPGLICAEITGYPAGPLGDQPALDEVIQMHCGLASQTGPKGHPQRAGASVIDMAAGAFLVIGILCALRERDATGNGTVIGSSLFEVGCFFMGPALATHQLSGKPSLSYAERDGGAARVHGWGIYDTFATKDGHQIFIAVTSDNQWKRFCEAVGLQVLLDDPALQHNKDRLAARAELVPLVAAEVALHERQALTDTLMRMQIPCAPVLPPEGLLTDIAGRMVLEPLDTADGVLHLPRLPVRRRSGAASEPLGHEGSSLPALGEHNSKLLCLIEGKDQDVLEEQK